MKTLLRTTIAAGCLGLATIAVTPASAQTKLSYNGWLGNYGHYAGFLQFLEEDFESRNPGVDFIRNDVAFEQALNQATVSHLGKNAADNIHLIAGWVPAINEIGGLEPLNDYFDDQFWSEIPKASLDSVTFDGQIMAVPWIPGPIVTFYNRNLMKQAGLDPDRPPQTWVELKDMALKICELPPVDGAKIYGIALRTQRNPNSAQWTIPIMYGHGGDVEVDGKVKFNTEPVRQAWTWVADLINAGCSPRGFSIGETRNLMALQRAGFIFEGPWGRGLFDNLSGGKTVTAPDGDIWLTPMPKDPAGNRRTIGNPHEITISSISPNKKLAASFIEYVITDPAFTDRYFEVSKQLSTSNLKLLTTGAMGDDAYTQVFVKAMGHTNDNPIKHPKFYAIMDELAPALQNVIQGSDVEKELGKADRKIKRLMSR